MFMAALFTTAKTRKQPVNNRRIDKDDVVCIHTHTHTHTHTHEYYSAIKKDEILPSAATWMNLEFIVLKSVRERQIPYDITYAWNLK